MTVFKASGNVMFYSRCVTVEWRGVDSKIIDYALTVNIARSTISKQQQQH